MADEEVKTVQEEAARVEQDEVSVEASAETVETTEALATEALEAALAEAKERTIRLMADMDNLRKRQARELEERTARANERLLQNLMPVYDNFEMALAAVTEETPVIQGVKMIADQFRKVLEQSGAEAIDAAEGVAFDPMQHEALSMVPHAEIAQGCVVTQFRKGWKLGGKVVRPAQVVVSAGAPEVKTEEA